ncbi:MAG: PQQ-binding-like beta-propeller repeat protein [Planctomycetes bacterium]|nr:PQQ-binding-like beta-propeller repeat protein [Planctomycetota bacterium]
MQNLAALAPALTPPPPVRGCFRTAAGRGDPCGRPLSRSEYAGRQAGGGKPRRYGWAVLKHPLRPQVERRWAVVTWGFLFAVLALLPLQAADPPPHPTFVDDDPESATRLQTLDEAARAGEWERAIEAARVLLDTADHLTADSDGVFRPIGVVVEARIAAWPAEGREAFSARVTPMAEEQWSRAGTLEAWLAIADRAPGTETALHALERVTRCAAARGDWALAARVAGRRLKIEGPPASASFYALAAFVNHKSGRRSPVLPEGLRTARVSASEETPRLAEFASLFDLRASTTAEPTPPPSPVFESGVPAWAPRLLHEAPSGSAPGDRRRGRMRVAGAAVIFDDFGERIASAPTLVSWATDGERLFINDAGTVIALRAATGEEVWRCARPGSSFEFPPGCDPTRFRFHVTPAGPLLLATRPEGLVACRRETGEVAWSLDVSTLEDESRKRALFAGAPLVAGETCFVAAFCPDKSGTATWLVRLDPGTGAVLWWRFVCSVDKPGEAGWNSSGDVRGNAALVHAAAEGLVICVPTQGVVSALEAETGARVWLRRYDLWPLAYAEPFPPGPSAALMRSGTLYVHPADGQTILALDPATGALRWPPKKVRWRSFCCGVSKDRLFLQGDKINAYRLSDGDLVDNWVHGTAQIAGAAAVSDGFLYIPTDRGIFSAPTEDLSHPRTLVSAPKEEPLEGSIVRIGPMLFLVSPAEIRAFVSEAERRRLLSARLAEDPDDAALRFAYASLLTAPEDRAEAMAAYRSAYESAPRDLVVDGVAIRNAARQNLRRLMLADARRLSEAGDPAAAGRFREARNACEGAEEHLEIALLQIEEAEQRDDWPAVVAVEQDLLARFGGALHRFDAQGPELPIRLWARNRIRRALERHGRALYAPFSAKARAAERIGPILGLRPAALAWQIGETYPFSPSARRACATLVECAAATGDWRETLAWADRYLLRYSDGPYAPRASLRAAEALAATGSTERARAAYRKAAERYPTATVPGPGGAPLSMAKAVETPLAALPAVQTVESPPQAVPALDPAWSWRTGNGEWVSLVRRPGDRSPSSATGRVVVLLHNDDIPGSERLRALRAADGAVQWEAQVPGCGAAAYTSVAGGPSDAIVTAGRGLVSTFEASSGRLLWTRRSDGRPSGAEYLFDSPGDSNSNNGGGIVASTQYAVLTDGAGRVAALDLPGRSLVASLDGMGYTIGELDLTAPENLVIASGGPGSFFVAYDLERATSTVVRPNGPASWLCADGVLYLIYADWWESRVEALDAKTGKSRWRTTLPALWSGWGWWRGWNRGEVNRTIALDAGRIWVAAGEQIHAVDVAQGRLRWSRPVKGGGEGILALGLLGDSVWTVAGGDTGVIASAFDREKGQLRWERTLPPGEARSACVYGGTLAVLTETNEEARRESLTLIDVATGVPTAGAFDPQPTAWFGELVVSGATLCRVAAQRIDAWRAAAPGGPARGEPERLEEKLARSPEDVDRRIELTASWCTAGRFREAMESARQGLAIPGLEDEARAALWSCQETAREGLFVAAPPAWETPRLAAAPRIDGAPDEWSPLEPVRLDTFQSVQAHLPIADDEAGPWTGPDDHSARTWLGWDEEALYFAAEVTDDRHDLGGALASDGDALRLWFAPPAESGESKRRPAAPEIAAITISVPEATGGEAAPDAAPRAEIEAVKFSEGSPEEETPLTGDEMTASAVRIEETHTTRYEARIPWKMLPKRPRGKAGTTVRIALAVIDRDGDRLESALKWTPIPWQIAGPVRFGTLRLSP